MHDHRHRFIRTCINNDILRFGEFTLKSGRISPYFFNAGLFNDGGLLAELASQYARAIASELDGGYMLYGPAYKGIPIVAATAVQLFRDHGLTVPYAFNRKEAKDHGEGGLIVGAPLRGDVVILDDVITAGTSVNESMEIIDSAGATPRAIVIALDRQETADGNTSSAVQLVEERYRVPVISLIALEDLVSYLKGSGEMKQHHDAIQRYRDAYGCR